MNYQYLHPAVAKTDLLMINITHSPHTTHGSLQSAWCTFGGVVHFGVLIISGC